MRTPKDIMRCVNSEQFDAGIDYEPLMLEIMCNVAITLDKLYKYAKEINDGFKGCGL